jgi:hypothetical protein
MPHPPTSKTQGSNRFIGATLGFRGTYDTR